MAIIECEVCTGVIKNFLKHQVKCGNCEYTACLACYKTYITSSKIVDIHCMSCRKVFGAKELCVFPFVWRNKVHKKIVESRLVDDEMDKLNETRRYLTSRGNAEMHHTTLIAKTLETLRALITLPLAPLWKYYRQHVDFMVTDNYEWQLRNRRSLDVVGRLRFEDRTCTVIRELEPKQQPLGVHSVQLADSTMRYMEFYQVLTSKIMQWGARGQSNVTIALPCADTTCNGIVNEDFWCHQCGGSMCDKCHRATDDSPHHCNQEDLLNTQAIMAISKPCPSCAARISKIEGCDQMWCTQCKTRFSWDSGLRISSNVRFHNPHMDDHERAMNEGQIHRQPGDYPCGGLVSMAEVNEFEWILQQRFDEEFYNCHQLIRQMQQIQENRRFPLPKDNFDLRLSYIVGLIDKSSMGAQLFKRQKMYQKALASYHVFDTFIQMSHILFTNLFTREPSGCSVYGCLECLNLDDFQNEYYNFFDNMVALRDIFNEETKQLRSDFKSSDKQLLPLIQPRWDIFT